MKFASVESIRKEAFKGGLGICEICKADVRAYCGETNIDHWRHINLEECDSWYEPKTEWHCNWQNHFDLEWQEVVRSNPNTNKKHRADIFNPYLKLTIEFQNSPISSEAITEREAFYGERMLWVINGEHLKENFKSFEKEFSDEWWFQITDFKKHDDEFEDEDDYDSRHTYVVLEKDIKQELIKGILLQHGFTYDKKNNRFFYILSNHTIIKKMDFQIKIYNEIKQIYDKEKREKRFIKSTYQWQSPRRTWQVALRPVFIDFGDDFIFRIQTNIGKSKGEGVKIQKSEFIKKYKSK